MTKTAALRTPSAKPLPRPPDGPRRGRAADLGLSPRELEIARLTCLGFSNKEIGKVLEISHHTVSTHLRRIYDKLQIHRRAKLADCLSEHMTRALDRAELR